MYSVVHTNSDTGFVEVKATESLEVAQDWAISQVRGLVETELGESFDVDHEGDDYGVVLYGNIQGHVSRTWCWYDEFVVVPVEQL